jgi:hypothetical protein
MSTGAKFIQELRAKQKTDEEIRKKLTAADWTTDEIAATFKELDDPEAPLPPHKQDQASLPNDSQQPISVVHRSSTLGVEYGVMFISLAVAAFSVGILAHNYIDVTFGTAQNFDNPLALSGALIGVPLFMLQFMRLRRQEQRQPNIKTDASRRRWVQFTLIVSFLFGIGHIIYYVYNLINGQSPVYYDYGPYERAQQMSNSGYQLLQLGHLVVTLLIAGSIFAYYWLDEHKQK